MPPHPVLYAARVGMVVGLLYGYGACAPASLPQPAAPAPLAFRATPPSVAPAAALEGAPVVAPPAEAPSAAPGPSRRTRVPTPDWAAMISPSLTPTEGSGLVWDGRSPVAIAISSEPAPPAPGPPRPEPRSLLIPLRRCYATRLAENPGLQGSLRVRLVVGREGNILEAGLERSSTGDAELDRCVLEVLRTATFEPSDLDRASVIVPLLFKAP